MKEAIVWLIQYVGQTESAYHWTTYNQTSAQNLLEELKSKFPDREWSIIEKDVS